MGRLCGGAPEISGIKAQIFSVGGWGWWGGGGGGRVEGGGGKGWWGVVMAHEISGIKAPIFLHGWVGVVGLVVVWVVVGKGCGWCGGVGGDGP